MAKKRKLNIPILVEKLTSAQLKMINNYLKGCNRIGAVHARFYARSSNRNRIEVYDIGNKSYIGAIYPDAACMIWPRAWYDKNKDRVSVSEDDVPYNALLNKKHSPPNNRRVLLREALSKHSCGSSKRVRVALHG